MTRYYREETYETANFVWWFVQSGSEEEPITVMYSEKPGVIEIGHTFDSFTEAERFADNLEMERYGDPTPPACSPPSGGPPEH